MNSKITSSRGGLRPTWRSPETKYIRGIASAIGLAMTMLIASVAFASESLQLSHNPANIVAPYDVVFVSYDGGEPKVKESKVDLPLVLSQEFEQNFSATMESVSLRGLPVHLPQGPVSEKSTWEGFSEVGGYMARNSYTLESIKKVGVSNCAEISYLIGLVPKEDANTEGLTPLQGAGRVIFDADRGIVIMNTWQMSGGGTNIEYAAVSGGV